MNKPKFRVGDYVIRTGPKSSTHSGKEHVITEVVHEQLTSEDGQVTYYCISLVSDGREASAWESHLELSEIMHTPLMKALR